MSDDVEPDAYGREGERSECWTCLGIGMEWGETCVVCGGLGWVRDALATPCDPTANDRG